MGEGQPRNHRVAAHGQENIMIRSALRAGRQWGSRRERGRCSGDRIKQWASPSSLFLLRPSPLRFTARKEVRCTAAAPLSILFMSFRFCLACIVRLKKDRLAESTRTHVCVCVMTHGKNTQKDEEKGDKGKIQDDNEQGMGYSCLCGAASYILTRASPPLLLNSLLRRHRPHVTAQTATRLPPSSSTHARILTSFRVSQRWAYVCTCACTDVLRKDRASSTGNRSRYTR